MRRIVNVKDFSRELVTNSDEADIPANAARTFTNMRADQLGRLRGIPGRQLFQSGPSTIAGNLQFFQEIVINDVQILFCYGLDGSNVQHLYYFDHNVLIDDWIEITEFEQTTVDAVTSSTIFTLIAGSSNDDHYNFPTSWWVFWHDVSTPANDTFDLVVDYAQSTKTLTTKYGFTGIASSDVIILMRFPLWNAAALTDLADGTLSDFDDHRNIVTNGFKPSIVQRQDAVAIYTGRAKSNLTKGFPNHSNMWLGNINAGSYFADATPFSYVNDIHCERKFLDGVQEANLIASLASPASGGIGFDASDYGVLITLEYDEYQESPIFLELGGLIPAAQIVTVAANDNITVNLDWDKLPTIDEMEVHPGSIRMTSLFIYLCTVDSDRKPTSPFFRTKQVKIRAVASSGSLWTAATIPYVQAVTLTKPDFDAAKANEAQFVHGYFDKVRVNADFGVSVNGREVVGSIVIGESVVTLFGVIDRDEKTSYMIASVSSSAFRNTPDALPEGNIKDAQEEGIYKIQAMKELGGSLASFGKNKLVLYGFDNIGKLKPIRQFDEKGLPGNWGAISTKDFLFWGSDYSIYGLAEAGLPQEIGFAIRDIWQGFTAGQRTDAIAAFHRNQNQFFLYTGGDSYIFDATKRTWKKLSSSTWTWLSGGVDGEILATDGTDIYELFSDSPTESLIATYDRDYNFDSEVEFRQIWLNYKSTTTIIVTIYDLEQSETIPAVEPILFLPQTVQETIKERLTFNAQRIRIEIQKQSSTDQDFVINEYSLWGNPLNVESDRGN